MNNCFYHVFFVESFPKTSLLTQTCKQHLCGFSDDGLKERICGTHVLLAVVLLTLFASSDWPKLLGLIIHFNPIILVKVVIVDISSHIKDEI